MPRFDEAQVKASHNSFSEKLNLTLAEQLNGDPNVPGAFPCRGIELDIVQAPNDLVWQVAHSTSYDADDPTRLPLAGWLRDLEEWAASAEGYGLVTIHLDIKNTPSGTSLRDYAAGLDEYIAKALGRDRILTPGELMGGHRDLVTAARAGAWPHVEAMDRFVICLTGNRRRKEHYAGYQPRERLCFVDRSWPRWDRPPPSEGDWVFLNVLINTRVHWPQIEQFTATPGFIVRGFNILNVFGWTEARSARLNVLSTDKLRDPQYVLGNLK